MEIQVPVQPGSSLPCSKEQREQGEMPSWKVSKTCPLLPNIKLLGGRGKDIPQIIDEF